MMSNKSYEYLAHTSDVQFRAYGKNLEQSFINAAYAMADIITDHTQVKATTKKQFSVEGEDLESLLYDFLEQFLFFLDSENFLLHEIEEITIDDLRLQASIVGDTHPEHYEIASHIKAVTYQKMLVEQQENGWIIQVIVDL